MLPCVTGVGKSYTLKKVIQYLRPESYAVTASTGCAAAIIGATTVHSTLGLGLGTQPVIAYVTKIRKDNPFVFQRVRSLRTLVIDEVGMLDGKLFDKAGHVVAQVQRNYTGDLLANTAPSLAWGDVQLIICGDFLQLSPVGVSSGGWIFDSKSWAELAFRNHIFTMIHRQHGDGPFAQILSRMRLGQSTAADLAYVLANAAAEEPEGALKLFAVNEPADKVNHAKMCELVRAGAKPIKFTAIDAGPAHLLTHSPAAKELVLCIAARVLCLKNLDVGLVNGSMGTVTDIRPFYRPGTHGTDTPEVAGCRISVLFDGVLGSEPQLYAFSTYDPDVPDDRCLKFTIKGKGDQEVASRFQIPLRHAWACSIHRSQGMSLDKVSIDFDRCFAEGMRAHDPCISHLL